MRSVVAFTQLALLASTADAFFPFTPKWLKERIDNDKRDVRRSSGEARANDGVSFAIKQRDGQVCTPTRSSMSRDHLLTSVIAWKCYPKTDCARSGTASGQIRHPGIYER